MLTREVKKEQYEELRQALADVDSVFLLKFDGIKVNDINELRSNVRAADGTYKVYKNSVVKLAIEGTPMEGLADRLEGPNALAYTSSDPVALAKALRDFVKKNPGLAFDSAFLEGKILEPEAAAKLADLPSREELIGKLVMLLSSPIRRLAVALNSPLQKLASALAQVAESQENAS